MKPKFDISDIFIEVFKAFPAKGINKDKIELSNNIILPPSALGLLSSMKIYNDSNNQMLFRILNIELNLSSFGGVAEFTAEEGKCYLPQDMFDRLCLYEGQPVKVINASLKTGTFIELQPHESDFLKLPNPKH